MANQQGAVPSVPGDDLASLRSACVKVTCEDGTVGTGYLIAPDKAVTCEHVVRRVKKDGHVSLSFFDGSVHAASVERVDASMDVALLRLPPDAPSVPPLRLVGDVERHQPFELVGFPQLMGGQHLLLSGRVHDPVGRDNRGASAIVLYSDMVAAGPGALMHGYSGSPVIVNGAVAGHLRRVLIDSAADRASAEMGLVFATPGREVLRFLLADAPPAAAPGPAQPPGAAYQPEWYIPRPDCERRALAHLEGPGSPAVLYGPRQCGKSWVLRRVANAWRQKWPQGAVAHINLLEFAGLASLEDLTNQLAYTLVDELGGQESWFGTYEVGKGRASPMIRLGTMVKRHALGGDQPTLLAIDATDAILGRPYASDFFGGLRAWMQKASTPPWNQLRLLMAISTTPSRMIDNPQQSPFNIAEPVALPPFSVEDITQLAQRHGLQASPKELEGLHTLTGGHPYLVRRVLFDATMAVGGTRSLALEPQSEVFGAHLDSLRHFVERESLTELLGAVLREPTTAVPPDQEDLLKKAWLVRRTASNRLEPTCTLHREYFTRVLARVAPR
ncbi:AAA-like domain-containing protein [Stigmatella aurantiaca]|nr:AAA-like domain-containing protein [Stigmatella aurantiaca]